MLAIMDRASNEAQPLKARGAEVLNPQPGFNITPQTVEVLSTFIVL